MVLLMRALDPLSHEKETDLYLEKLTQVDCYRQEYYKDLSKYSARTLKWASFAVKYSKFGQVAECLIHWLAG